ISNETDTGRLTKLTGNSGEIAFLKSLKADPNQILVAAITGPVTPYGIAMVSRTISGGVSEMQPATKLSKLIAPQCVAGKVRMRPSGSQDCVVNDKYNDDQGRVVDVSVPSCQ